MIKIKKKSNLSYTDITAGNFVSEFCLLMNANLNRLHSSRFRRTLILSVLDLRALVVSIGKRNERFSKSSSGLFHTTSWTPRKVSRSESCLAWAALP